MLRPWPVARSDRFDETSITSSLASIARIQPLTSSRTARRFLSARTVSESAGTANCRNTSQGRPWFPRIVTVNTADGVTDPATAGTDYTAITNGTVTFDFSVADPDLDGDNNPLTQNVSVPITSDLTDEPDETFTVNLSNAANGLITDAQGDGTITDDDAPPVVTIDSASAVEGSNVVFTVSLSNPSSQALTVTYTSANGTAGSGDYGPVPASPIIIPANTSSGTITVPTTQDGIEEPAETFTVTLTGATNGSVGSPSVGTGTINNDGDNSAVTIVAAAAANEGSNVDFLVSLSTANSQDVTVNYTLADITTAPADYTAPSGSIVIPAGTLNGTISVSTHDDNIDEINETFSITLNTATVPSLTIGTNNVGIGTIVDNDTSLVSINNAAANEGSDVVFTVTLSNPNSQAVSVEYTLADVSTLPADYGTPTPDPLIIAAGSLTGSINVPTVLDLDESDETFTVTLDSATNASVGSPNVGTGTITDQDTTPVYVNDNFDNPVLGQDPDGAGPATLYGFDAFPTVQGGVNGVTAGGMVIVYDGLYIAQVVISKSLTMDGESIGGTVIKMPSSAETRPTNSVGDVVIVDINNSAVVGMHDLTVSGTFDYAGCGGPYFDGIYVLGEANLTLSNAAVTDIRQDNPAHFGCQNGFAVAVGAGFAGGTGSLTVNAVTFDGYQKEALYIDGDGTTATVQNSVFNVRA